MGILWCTVINGVHGYMRWLSVGFNLINRKVPISVNCDVSLPAGSRIYAANPGNDPIQSRCQSRVSPSGGTIYFLCGGVTDGLFHRSRVDWRSAWRFNYDQKSKWMLCSLFLFFFGHQTWSTLSHLFCSPILSWGPQLRPLFLPGPMPIMMQSLFERSPLIELE